MAIGNNSMPHQKHQNSSFLDKSFNEQNTRNYVMSITLDINGCTVGIYDQSKSKVLGIITHHFEGLKNEVEITGQLEILLNTVSWLTLPFSNVNLVYKNNESTLVPMPLFDKNNAALYLEFNHVFQKDNRIAFDNIKHTDAVNVYGLPKLLVEKVKTTWPNIVIKHSATSLIENLSVLVKNKSDNNTLFIDVSVSSFDLLYFKDNKLHFYNQFSFHTKTDFVYFLLSAIEQLELNPESVNLMLLGKIDKSDEIYEIVYRYVRHIEFVKRNDNYSYSYVLDELKQHEHFVLFNSLQCE